MSPVMPTYSHSVQHGAPRDEGLDNEDEELLLDEELDCELGLDWLDNEDKELGDDLLELDLLDRLDRDDRLESELDDFEELDLELLDSLLQVSGWFTKVTGVPL